MMGPCREGGWSNNDEYMSVSTGLLVNGWIIINIILGSIWLRGGQRAMLQNGRMNRVCGLPSARLMRGILMANMGSVANRHYRPVALWHTIGPGTIPEPFELVLYESQEN
jgi:hypothetical protein